jgi:proton glutamate symport protein
MFKNLALHTKILIGLGLGIVWGIIAVNLGWGQANGMYVAPIGKIFINLLKLLAIPMIMVSLIMGISSLNDISKLGRIGGRTLGIFITTTVFAITIGLVCAYVIKPGDALTDSDKAALLDSYKDKAADNQTKTEGLKKESGEKPLQPLVDLFPENFFKAAGDNEKMLSIVLLAVLFGIAIVMTPAEKTKALLGVLDSVNEVVLKTVDIIMLLAPIGVFALISGVITDLAGDDPSRTFGLLKALGLYTLTVLIGLIIHTSVVYMPMVKFLAKLNPIWFLKKMRPVQLLAFSTSSSNATLPLNIENAEERMGVKSDVAGFVLPLGATVNMDGTSLYQTVAAIFIAQVYNIDLNFTQQLTIILTATLASIGSAGVPGSGMIMLAIVLTSVGIPVEGIALIMGPDRIIDMCRTVVNVTGDASVTCVIARSEGKLQPVE